MREGHWRISLLAVVAVLAAGMLLAACGSDDDEGGGGGGGDSGGGGGGTIALLLPESKTARYESQDRPNFEAQGQGALPGLRDRSTRTPTRTRPSSSSRPRRPSPRAPR